MTFEIVKDLTSDVAFKVQGKDKKELFESAAEALFTAICEADQVKAEQPIEVRVQGEDLKELLFNWLQELIALVDIEVMFFSKFDIREISDTMLQATVYGSPINPEHGNTIVKAITNYKFKLEENDQGEYDAFYTIDI